MSIFDPRVNLKPYEYPQLLKFKDAIRQSYWVHEEFETEFISDIQDYKSHLSQNERRVVQRTMLAISQIEISVKEFWGDIFKHCPKPEIGAVGYTFADCHVEGTEVLTSKGWVDFRDIHIGDEVMEFTPEGCLESTYVIGRTECPYDGEMYHLKKKKLDALITPNHKICYYKNGKNLTLDEVQDVSLSNTNHFWPEAARKNGEDNILTDEQRLYIAIQADGSKRYYKKDGKRIPRGLSSGCFTYDISVKKERKKTRLLNLLRNCDFVYREEICSRPGYVKYSVDIPYEFDYKEFKWINLQDKTYTWCEAFVQELAEWDGYRLTEKKDCKIKYSTTAKCCADMVQAVGLCAGYKANINTYTDSRKESYKDVYTVSFLKNRERVSFGPVKATKEHYKGKVYCISVPSKMIVTRYKDTTFISGNSEVRHADAYSHLIEILGLNKKFESLVEVGAISDRIKYLSKYKIGPNSSNQNYTKSLLLFSIFVEHVSLFSQFLILLSFNRKTNRLKGIANAVEATSKEEQIHGEFGLAIIDIIKSEFPEWFTEEFYANISRFVNKAYLSEVKILDWIFEKGGLDFLPRVEIDEFLKDRFNNSLIRIDAEPIFEVDKSLLVKTNWFDEEILSSAHVDFFHKRPTSYSKNNKSFTEKDLF